ncbi:MAG: NAD(P)H-dependent oxidoreductase [Spongiibacteraceae bacterium]
MKKLLIVYHSQSGATRKMAEAANAGALQEPEVEVRLLRAMEAGVDDLLWCDAVLFGTAEYLGYLSGGLKDFFDRTFYPAAPHQLNLSYAVFISAGNDGTGALRQLERIVKGYPLKCVSEPVIIVGEPSDQSLMRCEELGAAFAAGLSLGVF